MEFTEQRNVVRACHCAALDEVAVAYGRDSLYYWFQYKDATMHRN